MLDSNVFVTIKSSSLWPRVAFALALTLFALLPKHARGEETVPVKTDFEQLVALQEAIQRGDQHRVDAYVNAAADRGFGIALYMRLLHLIGEDQAHSPQAVEALSGALSSKVLAAAYVTPLVLYPSNLPTQDAQRISHQALALFGNSDEPDIAKAIAKAMLIEQSRNEVSVETAMDFYASAFAGSAIASGYLLSLRNVDAHSQELLCKVLQINKLVSHFRKCDGINLRPTEQYGRLLFRIGKQVETAKARLGNKYNYYSSILCDPLKGNFNRSLVCTEMLSAVAPFCEIKAPLSGLSDSVATVTVCTPRDIEDIRKAFSQIHQFYFADSLYGEGSGQ